MDINNINDMTLLKEELKKRMVLCIKDLEIKGCIFRKGQYYDWYRDECQVLVYDNDKNCIAHWKVPFELEEYFNIPEDN